MNAPIILAVLFAAMLIYFLLTDEREYRRFKVMTETRDRQGVYRSWLLKSFLGFGLGAVAALAWLGQLHSLVTMPAAFSPLSVHFSTGESENEAMGGFVIGLVGAVVALVIVLRVLGRKKKSDAKPKQIGDIQPLLPRNAAERWWACGLSLNAGLSEELFFRLALPLVLTLITGNVYLAFAIAVVTFGLMHHYQGWAGVIATGIVGLVMSAIYLATGSIWTVVILHAVIDLNGLLLMPYLMRRRSEAAAQ